MKVINIKEIEDCFDSSFIKEVLFDDIVTKDFIDYLSLAGQSEYYPTFAKPFFKVEVPRKYIVKGIEGNRTARIILYRQNIQECEKLFIEYVNNYSSLIINKY